MHIYLNIGQGEHICTRQGTAQFKHLTNVGKTISSNAMDGNKYDALSSQMMPKDVEDENPDGRINPPIIPA